MTAQLNTIELTILVYLVQCAEHDAHEWLISKIRISKVFEQRFTLFHFAWNVRRNQKYWRISFKENSGIRNFKKEILKDLYEKSFNWNISPEKNTWKTQ